MVRCGHQNYFTSIVRSVSMVCMIGPHRSPVHTPPLLSHPHTPPSLSHPHHHPITSTPPSHHIHHLHYHIHSTPPSLSHPHTPPSLSHPHHHHYHIHSTITITSTHTTITITSTAHHHHSTLPHPHITPSHHHTMHTHHHIMHTHHHHHIHAHVVQQHISYSSEYTYLNNYYYATWLFLRSCDMHKCCRSNLPGHPWHLSATKWMLHTEHLLDNQLFTGTDPHSKDRAIQQGPGYPERTGLSSKNRASQQ